MVVKGLGALLRLLDSYIRLFAYLLFVLAFLSELWLIFLAPDPVQKKYLVAVTIFVSAIMATFGWMWSGHINRKLSRKTEALNLLLALRTEEVNSWKVEVYDYIQLKQDGTEGARPPPNVEKLLGLYELVAIAVMSGTANEALINESQRFVFLRLYEGLREYIEKRQKEHSALYCHFVHYAQLWNDGVPRFKPSFIKKDGDFL